MTSLFNSTKIYSGHSAPPTTPMGDNACHGSHLARLSHLFSYTALLASLGCIFYGGVAQGQPLTLSYSLALFSAPTPAATAESPATAGAGPAADPAPSKLVAATVLSVSPVPTPVASAVVAPAAPATAPAAPVAAKASSPGTLHELSRLAMRTNPLIKSRQAELQSAESGVQGAKWQFYPTPYSRGERFEGKTLAVVGLRQPLWTGGRLTADVEAAQAGRGVSEWEVAVSRYDIAFRVANAWLEAVTAKGRLDAAQAGLGELLALEGMMKRRVATGYSASVDGNLVQARLMQARTDIDRAQSDITIALNVLAQLTGQTWSIGQLAEPVPTATGTTAAADANFPADGAWVDAAVDSHPANRRALAKREQAEAQVQQARKQIMPTLSARAEYQTGKYLGSSPEGYRFFVGFEQSFGSGLASMANVDAAQAMLLAAQEQSEAQRRELVSQIKADIASLDSARSRVRSLQSNVSDMKTVSDSYRRAFDAGRRSWLELLNVIREGTEVAQQVARARAEVDYYTYRLQVYQGTEGILE